MSAAAFALRADHEDFVGGSLAWGANQQTFDVGAALDKGGGVIIVDPDGSNLNDPGEQMLIEALDNYPALKRVGVAEARDRSSEAAKMRAKETPEADVEKAVHSGEYDEAILHAMDKPALWDIVDKTESLNLKTDAKKDELVAAILNHQKGGDAR